MSESFEAALQVVRARSASLAAASVFVLILGAFLGHQAYMEPDTERFTRETSRWEESAAFTYAVPIAHNGSVWPVGAVLPMGQPAYFRTVSDSIFVNFTWDAHDRDGLEGRVLANMTLRIEAQTADGRTYWRVEEPLDDVIVQRVDDDVRLSGVLALDPLIYKVTNVTSQLPIAEGFLNWTVEARVAYALQRADGPVADESVYALPIKVSDPRFVLPGPKDLAWTKPHVATETTTVEHPAGMPGLLRDLRAQGFLLLGAFGIAAALAARATDPVTRWSPEDAAFRMEHARHRDWITTASRPVDEKGLAPTRIDVDSLEELVHVAADARARVVLDETRRVYYVALPTLTYRYARHARSDGP